MAYNFDEIIDLRGVNALKVEVLKERFGSDDLMPLWVADMDFRTPDFIVQALQKRLQHPIFGYTIQSASCNQSIVDWLATRHQWQVERSALDFVPGVVKAIAYCVNAFTQTGDKIIIQPPVYYPFRMVVELGGRTLVNNQLKLQNGAYRMDFEQLRKSIDKDCKMLILCNPHNPGGVVWDKDTLAELAAICSEHNILVVSDEIHADLTLRNHRHTPFATVSEQARRHSITLMSPGKTFNIAGIPCAYTVVFDPALQQRWRHFLSVGGLNEGSIFAYLAMETAYTQGREWLNELQAYLTANVDFVDTYLQQHLPQIKAMVPAASYLMWLDCKALNLSQPRLVSLFVNKAKLALNNGIQFGPGGEGFMRLNIATPRQNLVTALEQLKKAVS